MDFNHYFNNLEIENLLHEWAASLPNLSRLGKIGESYEKHPIWLATLTNQETGPDIEKPAVWIDANIHATEITGATVAMRLIHTLLEGYCKDPQITRLLDNSVYYVVPRINPDGAALAMADRPRYIRSGVRLYPWQEKDEGLHEEDIDGDGRILQMRIQDPNGDWKISSLDPRLLEKRGLVEQGGTYYRLLPEGRIEDFDGYQIGGKFKVLLHKLLRLRYAAGIAVDKLHFTGAVRGELKVQPQTGRRIKGVQQPFIVQAARSLFQTIRQSRAAVPDKK